MTALKLDHRFQVLALNIVRFTGAARPCVAEALDALRDAQTRVMGCARAYPLVDTSSGAGAEPLYVQLRSGAAPGGVGPRAARLLTGGA
ncbi:hypothetical protein [Streptomyces sp. NPDC047968]|uniref:hypothetical protein n=1 Tax=unclassified Streptomyces TaxID=2593676 RepID=UPI003444B3B0